MACCAARWRRHPQNSLEGRADTETQRGTADARGRQGTVRTRGLAAAESTEQQPPAGTSAAEIIPHHETFSTIIQPPYSSTKGYPAAECRGRRAGLPGLVLARTGVGWCRGPRPPTVPMRGALATATAVLERATIRRPSGDQPALNLPRT
jgi:hypothetical protein